jgi:hypothetical protein
MNGLLTLIVAQGMAEYGGASGALVQAWEGLRVKVSELLGNTGTGTWIIVGGALLLLWFFLRGRR